MNHPSQILWSETDYYACREAKRKDSAWAADDGVTNYRLKDGDTIVLGVPTVADSQFGCSCLDVGTRGTVVYARTPRVTQPRVRRPSTYIYFANVDFEIGGQKFRGRVPHNAIRRAK